MRVSAARKRLLGGYGTGGQGAVALRFDDGHAAFKAKTLPLLRAHGLPSYIAVSHRLLRESGVTYAELQQWALNDGVEVTAHSRDHVSKDLPDDILSHMHTFGDDLQKSVGQIVVDTWTFPGGGDFGGVAAGSQAGLFAETYAGRLLLERYAVPYGTTSGYLQPLQGEPIPGQTHVTIEKYSLGQVQAIVRRAQDAGAGLTLMLHPTRLDAAGHMSSETLDAVLTWIAEEREAERLAVLTGTGMGFADAASSRRINMLAESHLPEGAVAWSGSGWRFAYGTASTDADAALVQNVLINPFAGSRGAPVELSVHCRGAAGDQLALSLRGPAGLDASRAVCLARTGWNRLFLPAAIPTGTARGTSITVAFSRISAAGTVEVKEPRLATI